jgi:hypothetical protein
VFAFSGEPGASFRCTINKTASYSRDVCVSPWSPSNVLGTGQYTFRVWQIDQAGNKSIPAALDFAIVPPPVLGVARTSAQRGVQAFEADVSGTVVDPQTTSEDSNVTLDVLAAIELAVPSDDSEAIAPQSSSDQTVFFQTGAELRSNLAWSVGTTLSTAALQGGSTGSRSLISDLDLSSSADSGSRNANNTAQDYQADYQQDVSWGDEAGTYEVTATHTATQTLNSP